MLFNDERPTSFDAVVGQKFIIDNIRQQSIQNKFFSVYTLSGQFGSGKTSVARLIAMAANCTHKENGNPCCQCASCKSILAGQSLDVIEIDGASNNGVNQVRELTSSAVYVPAELSKKVIIIDEVHMLSKAAFNAFLKTLEEPPEHCIFILATTEANAIPATVRSRSANYTFKQITNSDIASHVQKVAQKHDGICEMDAANLIAKYSQGALRNALGVLEQCLMVSSTITGNIVKDLLGVEDNDLLFALLTDLCSKKPESVITKVNRFYTEGKAMDIVLADALDILADAVVLKSTNDTSMISNTETYISELEIFCQNVELESILYLSNSLMDIKKDLKRENTKTNVIIHMIKLCNNLNISYDAMLSRIAELERKVDLLSKGSISMVQPENYQKDIPCQVETSISESDIALENETISSIACEEREEDFWEDLEYEPILGKELSKTIAKTITDTYSETNEDSSKNIATETIPQKTSELILQNENEEPNMEQNYFSMFNMFTTSVSKNVSTKETKKENRQDEIFEKSSKIEEPFEKKSILLTEWDYIPEMQQLQIDDVIISAIKNCCLVSIEENKTVLSTHYKPVLKLVNAYIERTQANVICRVD